MNRKGMALIKVAVGILILALLLVLLFFLFKSGIKAASLAEDSECQSSIQAHAILLKLVTGDIVPEITCPTKYYTITPSNEEKIKYYLAESVKSCWGTWGRGEIDLFKKQGTLCHVCSVIDFKKKGMNIAGFDNYLATHKLQDGPFKGLTYFEYLASAYKGDIGEVDNIAVGKVLSDNVINTDSTYAAIFVYAKGEDDVREFFKNHNPTPIGGDAGIITSGAIIGGVVGGFTAIAGVLICLGVVTCTVGGPMAVAGIAATGTAIGATTGGVAASAVIDDIGWVSVAGIKPYDPSSFKEYGCGELPVKQDMQKEKLG